MDECGLCPVFASYTLAFALQLRKKHTIHHDPARLQLRRNWHQYCTAPTLESIRIERQLSGIFCSNRCTWISCNSRQLQEANWTLHSSVTCISKKIYETRSDEWHTSWINPCISSLRVDTEGNFHPVVYSFHQTYKADKIRSFYCSNGQALFTPKESGSHYFNSRETC